MREVNFSIPNVNKASVGITAALYDRRALDSTSTLPLINSLNHLAYLTTSSTRIRDILTIDGGIERLVCILKEGRSKEMMETWKWNLAFQCVVNIGVRGSEQVRTRVVEANVVPVIATILENHARATERVGGEVEVEKRRNGRRSMPGPSTLTESVHHVRSFRTDESAELLTARHHPPPFVRVAPWSQHVEVIVDPSTGGEIRVVVPQPATWSQHVEVIVDPSTGVETRVVIPQPATWSQHVEVTVDPSTGVETRVIIPQVALTSPQEPNRDTEALQAQHDQPDRIWRRHTHAHTRSQDSRPAATNDPSGFLSLDTARGFGFRSVRDSDRLPSHLPALQNGITSQPESPTTPGIPMHHSLNAAIRVQRRPSLSQQNSGSGDSDDGGNDIPAGNRGLDVEEPMIDIQTNGELGDIVGPTAILNAIQAELDVSDGTIIEQAETDAFNIAQRQGSDFSIISTNIMNATNTIDPQARLPTTGPLNPTGIPQNGAPMQTGLIPDSMTPPGLPAHNPRDEDVLMSLQLLAYVSKYCNLRFYFQNTHLVPKLRIKSVASGLEERTDCDDEEYILPDDYNIFPLVEKFTVRHNSQDMQYWAGVVMRNLCRKDENQGGIRQCAYYNCGKWEAWPRQFAKCRRCRRTKYCSKECQKNAWIFHRHWCQQATP